MRKALGIVCLCLAAMLVMPGLAFAFVQMRGFELSTPTAGIAIPIQLGVAAVLLVVSFLLLRRGKPTR